MTEAVASVHERLQSLVGVQTERYLGKIGLLEAQRFAYALGHLDPRYIGADPQAALVHPLFLSAVLGWGPGPAHDQIRTDGTTPEMTGGLPLGDLRLMGAGQECHFHRDVAVGERLLMRVNVEHVRLKNGRAGDLIILQLRRNFLDTDEQPVLSCLETFIAR